MPMQTFGGRRDFELYAGVIHVGNPQSDRESRDATRVRTHTGARDLERTGSLHLWKTALLQTELFLDKFSRETRSFQLLTSLA